MEWKEDLCGFVERRVGGGVLLGHFGRKSNVQVPWKGMIGEGRESREKPLVIKSYHLERAFEYMVWEWLVKSLSLWK